MYAFAHLLAGLAGFALSARVFSVASDAPHVIVGVGVLVAALACFYGAVQAVGDQSGGHELFVTGLLVLGTALVIWVVRILHAAATGLVVTMEGKLDLAYGAVGCCGVGMILIGGGLDAMESRDSDIPMAVLGICAGAGATVLGVLVAVARV